MNNFKFRKSVSDANKASFIKNVNTEKEKIAKITPGRILPNIQKQHNKNSKSFSDSTLDDSANLNKKHASSVSPQMYCQNCPKFCQAFNSSIHSKFQTLLSNSKIDLKSLRLLSWNGIPCCCRNLVWKILIGYLPLSPTDPVEILNEKRNVYLGYVETYFKYRDSDNNVPIFKQICLDIPRTYPLLPIFQNEIIQKIYERILYVWAVRHPASSYVQGINDLLTPFLVSALWKYVGEDFSNCDIKSISPETLQGIESDMFWLLTKLLDAIQNNYTPDQPGIQYKMRTLNILVKHIDNKLFETLKMLNVEYSLFCFRWFNNLFVREFPLKCVLRLWDTLLAQEDGFEKFSAYVAASLLISFSAQIIEIKDFHSILMFFQELPTSSWTEDNINLLLAQAFLYYETYLDYVDRDLG